MNKLKLVLLLAVALISQTDAWAQNCVRNIRTKYDSAQNNELAALFPGKINPWLSSFNFAVIDNGIAFQDIPLNPSAGWIIPGLTGSNLTMKSPFSVSMPSEYDYLSQPFGAAGTVYDADIWWEDGWELMWMNTGFFPNGEAINAPNPNRILTGIPTPYSLANPRTPYIVLYNRYQGKLRVFANLFTDFNAYNHVRTRLSQPKGGGQNVSGIFRHLLNYDQTLDEPSKATQVFSTNKNNNNNTLWWSSDFQLGYDPCVCQKTSRIEFQFDAVKKYNLDLNGRIVQQNIGLSILNNPAYSNFLSNEAVAGANSENGGSLLFKRFDGLLDTYNTELDLYNTQLNSYNSFFNSQMRQLITNTKDAIAGAGGPFNPATLTDFALRQLVQLNGASKFDTTVAKGFAQTVNNTAKGQLGKAFDFLSVAAFGEDFMEKPKRPTMPTATFGEMKIVGTISDTGELIVSTFMTPGSFNGTQQLNPFNYPAYNEAVGLYALLRKPVVKSFEEKNTEIAEVITSQIIDTNLLGHPVIQNQITQYWEQSHKLLLRVNEPLKYKLNRALDFDNEKTKLFVSFVVELENDLPNSENCFTVDLVQNNKNFYVRDIIPVPNTTAYQLFYETQWKNIEDIGDVLFKMEFINRFQSPKIRVVELDSRGRLVLDTVSACIDETKTDFNIKKIKMKVAADMYFNQKAKNGLQNNNFQTFTYLLYDADNNISSMFPTPDSTEVLRYKVENLALNNEVIEPSDPFVVETIGTNIIVNAKTISLNGYVGAGSGYTATLNATDEITGLSSSTTLGPNIKFKTVNGFSPFGKNYETTPQELLTFCNSAENGYRANEAANKKDEEETTATPVDVPKTIRSAVYPNPATNMFFVSISADAETEYSFKVYDLMGRLLINEKVSGANQPQFEVDASQLAAGTYLLQVASSNGEFSETHRIVILD